MQLDTYLVPIRLYNSATHNNMLNVGLKMSNVKLPQMRLYARPINADTKDPDNATVNSSCVFSYLGIRGVALIDSTEDIQYRDFTAVPWLMLCDIYKNYYANKQEEEGCVLTSGAPDTAQTVDFVSIDGNTVNQAPLTNFVRVDGAVQIEVGYTGTAPNPEAIMINMGNQAVPLSELIIGTFTDIGPGTLVGVYDVTRWGNRIFFNWRYLTDEDIKNYAPKILRFQLSDIDDMRTRILQTPPNAQLTLDSLGTDPLPPLFETSLRLITSTPLDLPAITCNQEGLLLKT